jgi:uncharacterized protein (DUF3084 family)
MSEAPWQIAGQKGLWIPLEQYEAKIAGLEAERDEARLLADSWRDAKELVQRELDAARGALDDARQDFYEICTACSHCAKVASDAAKRITDVLPSAAPQPEGEK